jgi:hypothetical protein
MRDSGGDIVPPDVRLAGKILRDESSALDYRNDIKPSKLGGFGDEVA